MKHPESGEVVWVRLSSQTREKLKAVAERLHCSLEEAAALAVKTQLDAMEVPRHTNGRARIRAGNDVENKPQPQKEERK